MKIFFFVSGKIACESNFSSVFLGKSSQGEKSLIFVFCARKTPSENPREMLMKANAFILFHSFAACVCAAVFLRLFAANSKQSL